MATNPNGPSLNDLMYAAYNPTNPQGFLTVATISYYLQIGPDYGPGSGLSDNAAITEKMTIIIPGQTFAANAEDFTTTSENVSVQLPLNNNLLGILVSDTTVTSETVTRA